MFFLHYPTSHKNSKGEYVSRTNAEDRAELIKDLGKECFEENESFDYLRDPDIPYCFLFIFNSFIEIYNHCQETMTWTDILSYAIIRNIKFKQTEIDYILKCNDWANAKIKEMRDKAEQENRTEETQGQTSAD